MTMRDQCIEAAKRAIEERMGPVFGSPEYLADTVKLARAEKRRHDSALSYATAAVDTLLDKLKSPTEEMLEAALSAQKSERDSVIEECAKVAENNKGFPVARAIARLIAADIRNLKIEVKS